MNRIEARINDCRACRMLVGVLIALISRGALAQCRPPDWLPGIGSSAYVGGFVHAATAWDPDGAGPRLPQVLIGGTFHTCGGAYCSSIAAWNPRTDEWSTFGLGLANGFVETIAAFPNGDFAIGGPFALHAAASNGIAIWNSRLGSWEPNLGIVLGAPPTTMAALPNGDLVVSRGYDDLAVWNRGTGDWYQLGSGIEGLVVALAVLPDGDLVAGGVLTSAGGVPTHNVARWDAATNSWSALGAGLADVVSLTVLANGDVLACSGRVFKWRQLSGAWSEVGPGQLAGNCTATAELPDGDLVVIGRLWGLSNPAIYDIARFSQSSGLWTSLQPNGQYHSPTSMVPIQNDVAFLGYAGPAGDGGMGVFGHPDSPRLAIQPASSMASAGETVNIFARIRGGYSGVVAHWHRDGLPIADGTGGASSGGGLVSGATLVLANPTNAAPIVLTISGVQLTDAGSYALHLSNACGSVISEPASLTVTSVCPADFNAVGGLTVQDVFDFLTAWFSNDPRADFNGVGGLTVQDVFDFLGAWFQGCP